MGIYKTVFSGSHSIDVARCFTVGGYFFAGKAVVDT